jgi:hypothetical protein
LRRNWVWDYRLEGLVTVTPGLEQVRSCGLWMFRAQVLQRTLQVGDSALDLNGGIWGSA